MATVWRLVGRESERAVIEEAIVGTSRGESGLLLVSGDAGAGKTTLVESVLSSTARRRRPVRPTL